MSKQELDPLVVALAEGYRADPRGHRIGRHFLPSRQEIVESIQLLLELFYPGYHGRQDLTEENIGAHVEGLLYRLREKLARQIEQCLCFDVEASQEPDEQTVAGCHEHAAKLATTLLAKLPELRRMLVEDMQAALDGDPAAYSLDEVVLAYPGMLAVTVHRVAHELFEMGVPLMPRIMSEWAHTETGCDIHPGARIGRRFFVDHATGTVVGETSRIGDSVKLYQGVTLGALSLPRDSSGRVVRSIRRHPTLEDEVTIYANATVLGGKTIVGRGSVIGGSVFVTHSVPERSRVALRPPELNVRALASGEPDDWVLDFDI